MFSPNRAGGLVAAFLLCVGASPASGQGNPQLQSLGGFQPQQLRAAIEKSGDLAILREAEADGELLWLVAYEGINAAMLLNCPTEIGGKCVSVAFFTVYPAQISADAVAVNGLNRNSRFGWLTSHGEGRVAFGHSLILSGMTLDGFLENVRLNAAAYVVYGQELVSAAKSVSLPGVAAPEPGELRLDAAHQPAAAIGASARLASLLDDADALAGLSNVLADAQSYGEMRKIMNDLIGD